MLAESHYHEHAGADVWPFVLLAIIFIVAIAVVAVILAVRRKVSSRNNAQRHGRVVWPPAAQIRPSADSRVQAADAPRDPLDCQEAILEVLSRKRCPMKENEIGKDAGLGEEEVAVAIANLELQGRVTRTGDQSGSADMVELM